MRQGTSITGLLMLGTVGLFAIAGIYQLNKPNRPIVPAATTAYTSTLTALFK